MISRCMFAYAEFFSSNMKERENLAPYICIGTHIEHLHHNGKNGQMIAVGTSSRSFLTFCLWLL